MQSCFTKMAARHLLYSKELFCSLGERDCLNISLSSVSYQWEDRGAMLLSAQQSSVAAVWAVVHDDILNHQCS